MDVVVVVVVVVVVARVVMTGGDNSPHCPQRNGGCGGGGAGGGGGGGGGDGCVTPRMAMLMISSASVAGVGGLRDYSLCLWSNGYRQNVLPSASQVLGPQWLAPPVLRYTWLAPCLFWLWCPCRVGGSCPKTV